MNSSDELLALGTFVKLMRASGSVSARVHRPLAHERLSESQFGVLEALYHLGPLYQKDLAEKILKSSGNITMVVDNLQKQGAVERRRDQQDRRLVSVHLTDAGREMMERLFPLMAGSILREMSALSRDELVTLARLCRKLGLSERAP